MLARIWSLVRALVRRNRFEDGLSAEMRQHVDAYADDLEREGWSRQAAERQARLEFGPIEAVREEVRQAAGLRVFDEARQDLRYAVRQLRRSPGFTAVAVLSLALGIGANTAIFSLIDAVILRTMPVARPHELVLLGHRSSGPASTTANYPLLERYRSASLFQDVTAYSRETFTVSTPDGPELTNGQFVSGNYHEVLGVQFAVGRGFSREPDRPGLRAPVAVISDAYWARWFGRSLDVLGRRLSIGGRDIVIVGVTEPAFHGLDPGLRVDVTLPVWLKAEDDPEFLAGRDNWSSLTLIGRVDPGLGEARTRAAVRTMFHGFWMEPENRWARGPRNVERFGEMDPVGRGTGGLRSRYAASLWVLMAMVGVVLLIASANVANLLLARSTARAREVAVRLSIGAGRARLVRQFLTEGVVLALIGGVLSLLVASACIRTILAVLDVGRYPVNLDAPLSGRVLLFAFAVSLLTSIVFGVIPALRATAVDPAHAIKESHIGRGNRSRRHLERALVVAQVALCALVAATAGLFIRTLDHLRTLDAGFDPEQVLLLNVDTSASPFTPEARIAFYAALKDRLETLPGVEAVAYATRTPLDSSAGTRPLEVPGVEVESGPGVSAAIVDSEYFSIFGVGLVRGRGFTPEDRLGASKVGLLNESASRVYFGSVDPLGKTVLLGGDRERVSIVGIVRDLRQDGLRQEAVPSIYTSIAQPVLDGDGQPESLKRLTALVRAGGEPGRLVDTVRRTARDVSSMAVISYVRTMEEQVDSTLARERLLARLSAGFGGLALLLAFTGVYGTMSYNVARRTREIGVRMALGASRAAVMRGLVMESLAIAVLGLVLGLGMALQGTQIVSGLLFGVLAGDPATFIAVSAIVLGITTIASLRPATAAGRIDLTRAIRSSHD